MIMSGASLRPGVDVEDTDTAQHARKLSAGSHRRAVRCDESDILQITSCTEQQRAVPGPATATTNQPAE